MKEAVNNFINQKANNGIPQVALGIRL